jgi:hypothetical protein
VSLPENVICVRNENAAVAGRNVFSRLPMMMENALKLATILTENQFQYFIKFDSQQFGLLTVICNFL